MHTRTTQGIVFLAGEQSFTDIARVSVLRRVLLNGNKAGIDQWLILTSADPEKVRAHIADETRLRPITYEVVDLRTVTPEALCVKLPQGDAVVISCTALFDVHVLRALQDQTGPTLGVQPADAARPRTLGVNIGDGNRIVAVTGGQRASHRAVDLLRCAGPLLAQAIEQAWDAMSAASDPLEPVLSELLIKADVNQFKALDVSPYLWLPLADLSPDGVRHLETALLQNLGREGDSPIVRIVARRLSRVVTQRLIRTRVRPNHVTLVSGAVGICGALLLAQPLVGWQVAGSLLFLLSTVIDGCDGELARLTFQESAFGAKLDVTMDNVVHGVLFPAIALGLYRQQQHILYLILGALALGGVFLSMWVFLPHVLRSESSRTRETRLHESLASRDFAYALPILACLNLLPWFLWAAAIGSYVFAGAWLLLRWRQQPS